ncbi:hypothetical protein DIPPA_29647 [Diplonema papillatum]|nr:hypothetical protein DIPPA_29647 [Diplonema papillatum]
MPEPVKKWVARSRHNGTEGEEGSPAATSVRKATLGESQPGKYVPPGAARQAAAPRQRNGHTLTRRLPGVRGHRRELPPEGRLLLRKQRQIKKRLKTSKRLKASQKASDGTVFTQNKVYTRTHK